MAHSNSGVQTIIDVGHCELASQMFSSNLYRLKKLDLDFFNQDIGSAYFRQLKNLPNLEKLTFANLKIGLNDLEDLHNNLPALREFSIEEVTLLPSEMPDNIVPLPPTNDFLFYIKQVDGIETHIALYKYMIKKYANAKGGSCIDRCLNKYTPNDAELIYENAAFDFLRLFAPKRSEFTASHMPNGVNIFNAFDDVDCQLFVIVNGYVQEM